LDSPENPGVPGTGRKPDGTETQLGLNTIPGNFKKYPLQELAR